MSTFLITSATGRQGASTARLLLAKGAKVNALVRDPSSPASLALQSLGATLFKGGFDDVDVITAAIQGVNGVFLNTFPDFTDPNAETRAAETFVVAARAAGTVTSFVISTVYGANSYADWGEFKADFPLLAQYYTSKAGVEKVIRASGFTYTILRPGWLMHNYIGGATAYHFPQYPTERVLVVSYPPDFRIDHLDADDVGQFAAAALLDPARFSGKELDLVNEWLTFDEVAAHLSKAIGTEVKVQFRTEAETVEARKVLPTIEGQLWKPKHGKSVASLAEYGFRLTTFAEFLEREKSAIRKTVGIEA
ncbi:NAD dependent epimerase/dehydratase [Mycena alexandri]|uniref:NAD dependent epimerase/dehydratase n=1 Tax=Mycena alexandri TaxID=1745969 RepID=A0AAD6SV65_9AGAR|nr:NAD dependent epimerase/dehydratase [Mycena alexandri]